MAKAMGKEIMMIRYIGKRLLQIIPAFFLITIVVFFLASSAPGNPVDLIKAGGEITPEQEAHLIQYYGLDKPVIVRYFYWLGHIFQGDLGVSSRTNMPVWPLISERIGPTLVLSVSSLVVSLLIAIPLGAAAAMKPYSIWDNLSSVLAFVGSAAPNFFVSLVVIYIFSIKLSLLPAMGMFSAGNHGPLLDLVKHLILPCFIMVMQIVGIFIKETRGSMLDVINEEYVKTARSKGISELAVVVKHILRNSLIPIVSCISLVIPFMVGGAVVTEQVFGWPGMGNLLMLSISQRDYNVIMGITVLISVAVLVANLLIDLLYAYLNPKIRFN